MIDFDIRDRRCYVYTVVDPADWEKSQLERKAPAIVGTGHSLYELLIPDDPIVISYFLSSHRNLWAVVEGKRFKVRRDGVPLVLFGGELALSPDGRSLITKLPVADVPMSWETLYPPASVSSPHRFHAGRQDLRSINVSVHQYVRVDLQSASIHPLTDAPISNDAGWWAAGLPSWSSDGQAVLLPGTFLSSKDHTPSRPCVAVVDLPSNTSTCVEILKTRTKTGVEEGYHLIKGAQFVDGEKHRVAVSFYDYQDWSVGILEYQQIAGGTWQIVKQSKGGWKSGPMGWKSP